MRNRVFAVVIASGALLLAATQATFAAPAPATPAPATPAVAPSSPTTVVGQPTIDSDRPMGYYLWRDDGFHLRTHGPNAEHVFDAVLHTNGLFENVDPIRLEKDDRVDLVDGGHTLLIRFHTYDGIDGVNFTIRDGERLRLNLRLDDERAPTSAIFLGAEGRHPDDNPFVIRL
jgi:hypothetical protein